MVVVAAAGNLVEEVVGSLRNEGGWGRMEGLCGGGKVEVVEEIMCDVVAIGSFGCKEMSGETWYKSLGIKRLVCSFNL